MVALVQHDPTCPIRTWGHTDAAVRLSDAYRLHRMADPHGSVGKWISAKLSDGSSDGVLYDSKLDAVRHARHNEKWTIFTQIGPHDFSPCDAEGWLALKRKLDQAGIQVMDPDHRNGGMDFIPRVTKEDVADQMISLHSGGRIRPGNTIFRRH